MCGGLGGTQRSICSIYLSELLSIFLRISEPQEYAFNMSVKMKQLVPRVVMGRLRHRYISNYCGPQAYAFSNKMR